MIAKVHTRASILADSGIKPIEWPEGWYLWGAPDYMVSPKAPPTPGANRQKGGKRRGR